MSVAVFDSTSVAVNVMTYVPTFMNRYEGRVPYRTWVEPSKNVQFRLAIPRLSLD